jgi:type I restriction enzyme S subunit
MSSLSTRASLNEEMLERLTIALPSLETQTRIGRILKTLDDKIELNRRMNATLEAMARALFQSWFVDFDPVHAKAQGKMPVGMDEETAALFPDGFEDSELARIPRGWGQSTLGREVARHGGTIQTGPFGSQLHASDYVDQGVPVVMPKDIVGRRVSPHGVARVRESDAERLSRHRLAPGNIVYSRRGDVERHALIGTIERGWLCGTGCLLVRLGEGWPSPEFASFSLDRPETRAWISQHAVGATMPNLNTAILGDVPMLRIPEAVLRSYATLIRPIQSLTVQTEDESRLHSTLRDTLLPKLLSGELSVEAMAKEVEAVI